MINLGLTVPEEATPANYTALTEQQIAVHSVPGDLVHEGVASY